MRPPLFLVAASAVLALPGVALAKDYGVVGQSFPVVEPDLLATIEGRLHRLEATGGIARANAAFASAAEAKIRRPTPVAGLSAATTGRRWTFDPTMTLERDVRDAKGNLLARAGHAVNPLDFVTMRAALVFIDGDDPAELAWATKHYDALSAKLIFVSGSPIEAMTRHRRRFYFDQGGRLTAKFGITRTPAVAAQAGRVVQLTEVALRPETAK